MLAVTAAAFLLVVLGGRQSVFRVYRKLSHPLRSDWQRQVLASSGHLEQGMLVDAALASGIVFV